MKTVLITGCSSGIGFESALSFSRRGDTVFATMRDVQKSSVLQKIAEEESLDIRVRSLDVTDHDVFPDFIADVVNEIGHIDVLVNNAGILLAGAFEDQSPDDFKKVMDTNFYGAMLIAHAVLPYMRKQQNGYIINISSLSGIAGLPGDVTYAASKFAMEGAMEALRHEVDRWNIKIALIEAGLFATGIFKSNPSSSLLPANYNENSPYRPLIEFQHKELQKRLAGASDPQNVADLIVKISESDGSQLRWPADNTAHEVLNKLFAQDDLSRDEYLRDVSGTKWWSDGK